MGLCVGGVIVGRGGLASRQGIGGLCCRSFKLGHTDLCVTGTRIIRLSPEIIGASVARDEGGVNGSGSAAAAEMVTTEGSEALASLAAAAGNYL